MPNINTNVLSEEGQPPVQGPITADSSRTFYESPTTPNEVSDEGDAESTPSETVPSETVPTEATSESIAAGESETQIQEPTERKVQVLPGLRERGLNATTRQRFALVEIYRTGLQYPTPRYNPMPAYNESAWLPSGGRVMNTYAMNTHTLSSQTEPERFNWLDVETRERPRPTFYGTPAFTTEGKLVAKVGLQDELWVVADEGEVWTLAQCGFEALCPFGAAREGVAREGAELEGECFEPLVAFLAAHARPGVVGKAPRVFILGTADPQWRQKAARLHRACGVAGVETFMRALQGVGEVFPRDVSALFAHMNFGAAALREELSALPLVPPELVRAWESDPMREWPAAPREEADCVHGETLEALAPPQYLVEGLLLAGRPNLLTGREETGKSIITLSMALCICRGLEWHGRTTLQGDVFYVAGEGAGGVRKRKAAWEAFYGQSRIENFHLITHPLDPSNPRERHKLLQAMARHSTSPALVVFDTLSLCFAGDENDSGEMGDFVKGLEVICRATGAACLVLHHHNRQDEYRGSSVMTGNCEVHLTLTHIRSEDATSARGAKWNGRGGASRGASRPDTAAAPNLGVRLRVAKLKDSVPGENLALRPRVVEVPGVFTGRGQLETSAVFLPVEANADAGTETGGDEAEKVWLSEPTSTGTGAARVENPSVAKNSPAENAPPANASGSVDAVLKALGEGATSGVWLTKATAQGVSKTTFDRARRKLMASGKVQCAAPGQAGALYVPTAPKP